MMKKELFGPTNPIGKWVRIGDRRFRVIGILASEGRSIGLDVQDLVITPVASAQAIFNTPSLFRIMVEAKTRDVVPYVIKQVTSILKRRHQGEEGRGGDGGRHVSGDGHGRRPDADRERGSSGPRVGADQALHGRGRHGQHGPRLHEPIGQRRARDRWRRRSL